MKILRYLDPDPYGNFNLDPDPYGHEDITWIRIPMEILRYLDLDPYGEFLDPGSRYVIIHMDCIRL